MAKKTGFDVTLRRATTGNAAESSERGAGRRADADVLHRRTSELRVIQPKRCDGERLKAQHDAAIDQVGQRLYGQHWLGAIPQDVWKLAKRYDNLPLPIEAKAASRVLLARHWCNAGQEQMEFARSWWAGHGVETFLRYFDQTEFEKLFARVFGATIEDIEVTKRRKAAVADLLRRGQRPERGVI